DKMLSSTALGDKGAMKTMGKKSFGTTDYKGKTQFTGSKDYKTKDFAQSGKPNRAETQLSSMGGKKSNVADKTFATNDSRWSTKSAQASGKVFNGSKQEYKTSEYGPAVKSLKNDKRPYFQAVTDMDKAKTYPEEEVRALLNRN
ncbi:MAG: hypothetical protein JWO94_3099, partial [Verrucomicrobiaceae bacterium]|nr:hypothetical protein [Verrucomicrobiaceae bacterium]